MMRTSILINILPAILTLFPLFSGCSEPTAYPELVTTPSTTTTTIQPSIQLPLSQHQIIGTSVNKRPILAQVLGHGPDVTLVLATIHGDETAGTPLVHQLARYLQQNPHLLTGRTVILVPVANPDGMAAGSRYNANQVDLNRNFATANRINNSRCGYAPLSEPEARAIRDLIRRYAPNRIISIHQPLGCIDYDGPARHIALAMARHCHLPVKKLGARPGSLGSYAGLTLHIPIITLELLSSDSYCSEQNLWQKYGSALLAGVLYPQHAK